MTTLVVRLARARELDEVARVLAAAFDAYRPAADAEVTAAYRSALERYLDDVADVRARIADAELFVAVEAGRVLGTGSLYAPRRAAAYARAVGARRWPEGCASLRTLAVDPAQRRRGIGRALMEARVRRARELGARAVALHTSFEGARRMAYAMGFRRAPAYDHAPLPEICAEAYILALV